MSGNKTSGKSQPLRDEIKRLRKSLSELTPQLDVLLKRRGFRIYKREPSEDLLLPEDKFIGSFYEMMKKYSFRLFLREVIKHQKSFRLEDVARYATLEVTKDYLEYMTNMGLVEKLSGVFRLSLGPIKSFGETLEWFVAEIFKVEFTAEAIWGIRFKRPRVGGDYDLIAKVDGSILYMEIKSSPPKQIYQSEISAFFERVTDLSPEISIFFVDTELRMKDKIVLMFEEELKKRHTNPPKVTRIEKELFQILDRIFIINAKDSITANIEKVLSCYFRRSL
ncbi:MAG: hypothetical protein A2Y97_01585 [Nitrospirae bacterium RBG_13_39_12]|nr:MAG: hypothetical protein A2Y97_01585 [Nitrospirae bacterium RBG_13_39_12]